MTFPITDFMSDDYAPPYRAALRPTDFEFFDGSDVGGDVAGYWGWRVRGLARDGSPCDYVIANAYCFDPFEDEEEAVFDDAGGYALNRAAQRQ